MKKYIHIILIIICAALFGYTAYVYDQYNILKDKYSTSMSNEKALLLNRDSLINNVRALTLTIDELEIANDSVIKDLNKARKDLKIKDKELKQLYNTKVEIKTTDTLILRDTIFKNESIKLDTLMGDKWHQVKLHLEYPNIIAHQATYTSDLNVAVYTNKEPIDPPKKCFISRWFQKKHKITRVEVVDNNPYSELKNQTFILIDN